MRRATVCCSRVSSIDLDLALRRRRGRLGRAPARGGRRCAGAGCRGGLAPVAAAASCGRLDVGLHDPPARAGAASARSSTPQLARDPPRDRRGLDAPVGVGRGAAAGGDCCGPASAARPSGSASAPALRRLPAVSASLRRRRPAASRPRSPIRAITSPIGSVSPSGGDDLDQHARRRRPRRSCSPCRSRSRRARRRASTSSPVGLRATAGSCPPPSSRTGAA